MKRPILVTGIHKSGTTWVGKILASSRKVGYVYEPFNYGTVNKSPVEYWYEYVGEGVKKLPAFERYLESYLKLSPRYLGSDLLRQLHSSTEFFRILRTKWNLLLNKRQLIKDPIAVLSAEWLADRFDMDVVVLIKHPAGFVASAKTRNYDFPFEHLLEQEELMERYLFPYESEILDFARDKKDAVTQAILLWKLIYHVVHIYQEKYPNWIFLRNEDIALDPEGQFQQLFDSLNIPLTDSIRKTIYDHSHSSKSTHTRRDSKQSVKSWKKILTAEEISQTKASVSDVSRHFYQNSDW